MANVVGVVPARDWLAQDDRRTIDVNPATFGVARGAIAELEALATKRDDEIMLKLVADLTEECRSLRSDAYARMGSPGHESQRLMLRAKALDHVVRATTAVVIARAGAAMMSNQDATRRVREAMFLQVQAQTAATRAAALRLAIDGP
jgi:phosphatidylserine/phosphatidylglycerophosphate/cardiolipin synthase-like enzyme